MFVTSAHAEDAKPAEAEAHPPAQGTAPAGGHAQPAAAGADTHGAAATDAHGAPAAGGHQTGTEAGHGESVPFPPFDSTYFASQLLWLAITFGLFYIFLKKVILPRIANILEVRHDRIASDLDQAARLKEDADGAVAAYEQELAEARNKAGSIGQEARDKAKADADAERKKVEAALDLKLAESDKHLAGLKSKAMGEVGSIAETTASTILEHLTGAKHDKAAIAAAVKSVRN